MTDPLSDLLSPPSPTAARPLLGNTVMVVEDSRYASEAMRLLCLRSGARIRRADSLASARKHLKVYVPNVMIVDMGLPDGSGTELISEVAQSRSTLPVILGLSGDIDMEASALEAGADGFIEKPISSISKFQDIVLRLLPADSQPQGLRIVKDDIVEPDPHALQDDFMHIADILALSPQADRVGYVAQFLYGLGHSAGDTELETAAHNLSQCQAEGSSWEEEIARVEGLVQARLAQKQVI